MLREGLAAEFPFLVRAARSLRRPRVAREAPLWAMVSAFGAAWIMSAAGQAAAVALRLGGDRAIAPWIVGAFGIASVALAVAVAWRAGGPRGLLLFLIVLVVRSGVSFVARLPGFLTFCERSGERCSYASFLAPEAYAIAGTLLGIVAVRLLVAVEPGTNPSLSGLGAFSLASSAIGPFLFAAGSPDVATGAALTLGVTGAAAFVAGVTVAARGRAARPLVAVGLLLAGAWLAYYGALIAAGPGAPGFALYVLLGPAELAAFWLGTRAPLPRRG